MPSIRIGKTSIGGGSSRPYWTQITPAVTVENTTPLEVWITSPDAFNSTLPDKSAFILEFKTISSIALDATKKILKLTVTEAYVNAEYIYVGYNVPSVNPLKIGSAKVNAFMSTGTNNVAVTAEYTTIYNALTTKPNTGVAMAQNKMLSSWVSGGVWGDIDSLRMLAQTVNTDNEALKDWKDMTKIATLHGSTPPVFTAGAGFEMKKTDNRYIDLLWKPSDGVNYTLNNACILVYITKDYAENSYDLGVYDGTYYMQVFRNTPGTVESIVVNGGNAAPTIVDGVGLYVCNRISDNEVEVWHKGILLGTYTPSAVQAGLATTSVWLGARHDPATVQSPSTREYALIGFGKALTSIKVGVINNSFSNFFNCEKFAVANAIHSAFIQTDFSEGNLSTLRTTIKGRIWPGGLPVTGVDHITTGVAEVMASSAANLDSIDELTIHITGIADRTCYVWHPAVSNGKFIIYHHDHFYALTGTDIYEVAGRADLIRALIDEGYTVCRIPMPQSNDGTEGKAHSYPVVAAPFETVVDLHYFLDSTIRVLNEFAGDFTDYYMVGFSGGGWSTTMMAAIDERITKSATGAGDLPISATNHSGSARDWEQALPGLTDIIDYGDLHVMACTGLRKQYQGIIKYENYLETGYNIVNYRYAPYAVKIKSLTDRFTFAWDETVVTHSISPAARAAIIAFLNS